jgi:hypothetical protein
MLLEGLFYQIKLTRKLLKKRQKEMPKNVMASTKKETKMMRKKMKKMNLMEQVVQEQRRLRSYQQRR